MPDGSVKHVRVLARRTPAEDAESVVFVGAVTDITERKRAEEEHARLRQLEADLARINRVSMMGELAASLAHEIKQPIAGVAMNAATCLRWLQNEPPRIEDARREVSAIVDDVKRATDIIDRNHSFYRRGSSRRELIDLNEVIRHMIALLRDAADRNSISIRTELDPEVAMTTADRVQLQQVLMNLMLNGIEAMKGGSGALMIASKQSEDGQLMVSVSDSGIGLPVEGAERIFEAFFTTKPDGTGIGLPLSRRIVEFAWRPFMGEREHASRSRLPFHGADHSRRYVLIGVRRQAGLLPVERSEPPGSVPRDCPVWVCAVRRRFPVGARPTRQPLQPEATGAVTEATKWLKPWLAGHELVTARVCRPQRE